MRVLMIGAALLLTACMDTPTDVTEIAPDAAMQADAAGRAPEPTAEARAACRARNGEMRTVGMLGSWQCVVTYADAGKRCTDGDQCLGDCRADAPAAAEGVCQADSSPFGCYSVIEDGKAAPTLCVD